MSKLKCILVEDEPLALKRLESYVRKTSQLSLQKSFDNSQHALQYLNDPVNEVDLVFLDVRMDEISGIELIELNRSKARFILTTAYDEYALKGYDLDVIDYLLKPFSLARFTQSVLKAIDRIESKAPKSSNDSLFVKSENRLEQILYEDILIIEGMRDYRRFHLKNNKRIMTLETFKDLEKRLPKDKVFRVHKSYMIAVQAIQSIERKSMIIGEHRIPISDTYYSDVIQRLQINSLSNQ